MTKPNESEQNNFNIDVSLMWFLDEFGERRNAGFRENLFHWPLAKLALSLKRRRRRLTLAQDHNNQFV
jgi:hydroxypyruvate isomerase